jgi:hypothetical protein
MSRDYRFLDLSPCENSQRQAKSGIHMVFTLWFSAVIHLHL